MGVAEAEVLVDLEDLEAPVVQEVLVDLEAPVVQKVLVVQEVLEDLEAHGEQVVLEEIAVKQL